VSDHLTPHQVVLANHGITLDDIRAEIEHTRLEQTLRRAGRAVPADLVRLVASMQAKVAGARHELYYLLPRDLQDLQHRSWMDPDTTDQFNDAYLSWLESRQP
jgi:hypothetical protein